MVQGEAGPSVCYDPCGPQKSGPALLKGFGATSMASSASAQRPLYCRASGNRPGRVGCACVWVTPVAMWGQERIANELLVKLGLHVSPRTVRKYLPKPAARHPRGDQRWATFLRNPAQAIVACDFFVTVTSTFRLLYASVVMEHRSRRLIHCNVTAHPPAAWTRQQLREALGVDSRYSYLIHDRDKRHRARQRR